MSASVRPIQASAERVAAVQALHERSADYVMRIWGLPPGPDSGREFFARRPPAGTVKTTAIVLMKPLERDAA